MANKEPSGYYILKILRCADINANASGLYVELQTEKISQRTQIIKNLSLSWTDTLPIFVPKGKTMSLSLYRSAALSIWPHLVGSCNVKASELARDREGKTEATHALRLSQKNAEVGQLHIELKRSSARDNAMAALENLLMLLNKTSKTCSTSSLPTQEQLLQEGKDLINSDISTFSFSFMIEGDTLVQTVDKIVDVDPHLKAGWALVAGIYKVALAQKKLDNEVHELVTSLVLAFFSSADAFYMTRMSDALPSLRFSNGALLDLVIQCSLFISSYFRRVYFARVFRQANDKAILNEVKHLISELRSGSNTGLDRQAKLSEQRRIRTNDHETALEKIQEKLKSEESLIASIENPKNPEDKDTDRKEYFQQIVTWARSETAKTVFWLRGDAGSGKSLIAQNIARHPELKIITRIYFHRQPELEEAGLYDIHRLIAYRLAAHNFEFASEALAGVHRGHSSPRDSFNNLILTPLRAAQNTLDKPVLIILDALDDYGDDKARGPFLSIIKKDFSNLPSKVRFLITSRPTPDLVRALEDKGHIEDVTLTHSSPNSKREVSEVVKAEMSALVPKRKIIQDVSAWNNNMVKFETAADGLFIWVSVAVGLVKQSADKYDMIRTVADAIDSVNGDEKQLDKLYRLALRSSEIDFDNDVTKQTFSRLFTLLLSNNMPLTIDTIDWLLGLEDYSSEMILSELELFVTYNKWEPVRILHPSFAEFLQSTEKSPVKRKYINSPLDNQFIVERCFKIMEEELCYDRFGSMTQSNDSDVECPAYLRYAILYWAEHLQNAAISEDIIDGLRSFLSERLLFWLEALICLREFSQVALDILLKAAFWTIEKMHNWVLLQYLSDAHRMVSKFSSAISEGPKLVYALALPLTPKTSSISTQYARLMSKKVNIGKIEADIGALDLPFVARRPVKPFSGHQDAVVSVVFSPDNRFIISGSWDGTIRTWEKESGASIYEPLVGHSQGVTSISVSADGQLIISGGMDKTIRLWDLETGKSNGERLRGHTEGVSAVAISPDGRIIASGSYDYTVRLWNAKTRTAIGEPHEGHKGWICTVTFSPNGRQIASASEDSTIRIWDSQTGREVTVLRGHSKIVNSVAFSPNGDRIVSCSDDCSILIWNAETFEKIGDPLLGHSDWVEWAVFSPSPDGLRIISSSSDRTIMTWDPETGKAIGEPLLGHEDSVYRVAVSSDGSKIVSGDREGRIILWDAETGRLLLGTDMKMTVEDTDADGNSNIKENDELGDGIQNDQKKEEEEDQFFAGWRIEDGWIIGAENEYRLWLPRVLRHFVKEDSGEQPGLRVHRELDLANCNGSAEDMAGFVLI